MPVALQRQTTAPGPLAPFGVTEAAARRALIAAAADGADVIAAFMNAIVRGYDRVPAASRAPATTAALAWARTFLESVAFVTEYGKARAEHKPDDPPETTPIDEEVQKRIAKEIAEIEAGRKVGDLLPAKDRAAYIATVDAMIADRRKPEYAATLRTLMEINRTEKSASFLKASVEWTTRWPPTPAAYVRIHLQQFMAATANVDFESPAIFVKDAAGRTVGFLRPGLTGISPEHMRAIVAGQAATSAARAAIDLWLKEPK